MRIYFFSSCRAALKINGEFCGFTDGFRRYAELSLQDGPLIEWVPVSPRAPLSFVLDESVLARPPFGVKVCLIPGGLALCADKFPCADPSLSLLLRAETQRGELLVYRFGEAAALWQGKVFPLPFLSAPLLSDGGDVLLLQEGQTLCALCESGVFYRGKADEVRLTDEELSLRAPLRDLRGRKAIFEWRLSPSPVLTRFTPLSGKALPPPFYLCGLMESLFFGEDLSPFAGKGLEKDAAALKDYLGAYVRVYPLGENEAGGIYLRREGVYEMRCFRAETSEGKIVNVTRFY